MIDLKNNMMTLAVAAKRLDVEINTLRRAVQKRKLQAVKIGRGYRVSEEALSAYIELNTTKVAVTDEQ